MSSSKLDRQPWEFRFRVWLIMFAYAAGFVIGYIADYSLGGRGLPTYVVVGRHFGENGVRVASSIGALLAIAGFLVRWWASSYHRAGVVMDTALHGERLTVSGPYRYVRNPLYFGNLLQAAAIGAMAPIAGMVLVFVFVLAVVLRLIALEEGYLRATQGQPYLDYCAAVPSLVPRLEPIGISETGDRPNLPLGFLVELGTFGFAVTLSYFAIALPDYGDRVFYALWYASFFLLFVSGVLSRRLAAASHAP